jgi:2-hydroxy-3-oxopropionate reductase
MIAAMSERVGFIGLGVMGRPLARRLVAAGYDVTVHNRSRGPADELVRAGAIAESTPAGVARRSTVVMTMLPDTSDVEMVLTGPHGVLAGLTPGSIVVDMSSISPVATRQLATLVAAGGGTMLDAPVSGGETGAIEGTLSIMVGGEEAAFARVRPLLAHLGDADRIVHVDPAPGAGQICKICNQIAIGGALAGVAEAFALAIKAGIDPARVRSALLGGYASSRVLEVHGKRMLSGDYAPGFRTRLYQKDLRIAAETAAAHSVATPVAALMAQFVNALMAAGGGELDTAAIATVYWELAGLDGPHKPKLDKMDITPPR